jgi:hypothetical protein
MLRSIQQPVNKKSSSSQHEVIISPTIVRRPINIGRSWLVETTCAAQRMLGKYSVVAYRQQTLITVAGGGETPSLMVLLLVDQPFSVLSNLDEKPMAGTPHQAGQEQRIQFLGAQHPHLVCMMVRILLNSTVDITSWTGKKKRTTSNLLSSHDCQQYRQHGKHWTTCLIVRERTIC